MTKSPDSPRKDVEETAWLIELNQSVSHTPAWYGETVEGMLGVTTDSLKAVRFSRKQDAEAVMQDIGWTEAFVSEHMWCDPRALKHEPEKPKDTLLQSAQERIGALEKERDGQKAESVWRGKMLIRLRDKLIWIRDEIDDEGDRAYFGSTNHADMFKEVVDDLDAYKWDRIMAEKDDPDILEKCRQANERANKAEARIAELEKPVTDEEVAECERLVAGTSHNVASRHFLDGVEHCLPILRRLSHQSKPHDLLGKCEEALRNLCDGWEHRDGNITALHKAARAILSQIDQSKATEAKETR